MMNYLGIDLGTSSVKGLLVDEKMDVLYETSRTYPIDVNEKGYSQQNPEDWINKTLEVIKEILSNSKQKIEGISFSGQMHGLVVLDENDEIIRPAILWNDQRTSKQCDYLNNVVKIDNLIKWTGNYALNGFTANKIMWLYENEKDNFERINKIMLPKDYLVYYLTNQFVSDCSDLSGSLLFDVKNKKYSKEMLDIVKIDIDQLPRICESNEVVGFISDKLKSELDLEYDIKVIVGGGDQAMAAIGTNTINNNDVSISLGTSGVVYAASDKFNPNLEHKLHSFCDATGKYHTMGVMLSASGSMKWWYEDILKNNSYANLESDLSKVKMDPNLFFLPYLIGERSPINDDNIRGSFHGLSLHHKQIDLTYAVIEGVTFCLKQIYDCMDLKNVSCIKVTGGGSKNKVWLQLISDVFNKKVVRINTDEGPALGACILAKSGSTNQEISEICRETLYVIEEVLPSEKTLYYKDKYEKFIKIYPKMRELI